ncbi:sugar phosphate isomerase/epimerase family protein [Parapedobacter indicus]|uniref:Sugar phosphate isomerase/epimerase n=1 Tax=Parapedobacter indicus TaxID=1477437 RepID=A0A1I3FGB9_9SPHI|nr:sugar phosphate isomerase/epimerase family protein [Parapedobacter indicus]PPL03712.1 sugar phosphate isomerase/epimerase [Parapedobacter indicus]SFI10255.1 Sugar phosphate isomerase/epimerase [Parapedobacter indicus]
MSYNRRVFIAKSLSASFIGLAPLFLKGGTPVLPGRKFTMSLNPYLIGVEQLVTQRDLCTIAHRYGFESVSVITNDLMEKSDHELDALLEEMKKMKLSWGVSFLYVEYRKDEETYRKGLEQLPAMAKVLHKIGADRMMTYIMSNHDELNYLQNFRQTATRLREIAGILADQDIRLGLEYVGPKSIWSANKFPFIHTMAETKELIAAIGRPNVGFHLDTAHWFTSGENVADLKTLENSDIVGCDLNDAIKGITWENQPGYQRELPLATGVIDTESFLEALVSIGYDGPVQAEPFNEALTNMNDEQAISATAKAMKKAFALVD